MAHLFLHTFCMSPVLWEQEMFSVLSSFYLPAYCQCFLNSVQCAYKLNNHYGYYFIQKNNGHQNELS